MISKIKLLKNESGQAIVLVALMFVVLFGFSAVAIDCGRVAIEKEQLQNTADAAALAGAQDLPNTSTAVSTAENYAELNRAQSSETTATAPYNGDSTKIEVVCSRQVEYTFARVLGFNNTTVSAKAVASNTGASSGISGLRPWAVQSKYKEMGGKKGDTWTGNWLDYTYTYGLEFELKAGGGGGSNGYYGVAAFGNQNASSGDVYKKNISDGYDGIVMIGDYIEDGPGNKNVKNVINDLMTASGDTEGDYTKATKGNSRVVFVPKVDPTNLQVIGFAAIYLKSVDNQGYITANFLYDTTWSESQKGSYDDWGLESNIKLTE